MRYLFKGDSAIGKIRPRDVRRIFGHFGHHVRPHWRTLLLAGSCTLGLSVAELLQPWPIKLIFDQIFALHPKTRHLDFGSLFGGRKEIFLAALIGSIIAINVLKGFFDYQQSYLIASAGQKVLASIRRRLYGHIQRLSRSFHDTARSGDLLTRLTRDINSLGELLVESILEISDKLIPLLGMVAIMLWMDWQLTLTALGVFPFLTFVLLRSSAQIKVAAKRQRQRESQITSAVSETIAAISVVQAFTRERYEDERFSGWNRASLRAGLTATRLEAKLNRLVDLILAVGTCGILWLGARKVMTGVLTPGDLLVFIAYLSGMYRPIRRLARLTSRISKSIVSGERVIAILETEPEIKDAPDAVVAPPFRGEIAFEEVIFWYRPGEPVLNGVSFVAKPDQVVALVGPSGVGKSTIANLLLRFYDPVRGRILIDGTDIRRYTLDSLREQIGVVLQESILFATTIRENIAYGKLDATFEEIVAAAKAANAHDFILEQEHGYDTAIGERGDTLSGGQKQRIAIARAVVRNAPILILDEPMTGLDVESETKVLEALTRLMAGKTCLLITHDLQAITGADLILVLEDGRIVEQGTHKELLANGSRYSKLIELQNSGALLGERDSEGNR